jgi:hypothetical protein
MFALWTLIIACLSGGGITLIVTLIVKLFKSIKDNKEWKYNITKEIKELQLYKQRVDELMNKKAKDEKDEGVQSLIFKQTVDKVNNMMIKMETQFNCYNEKLNGIEKDVAVIKKTLEIKKED